MFIEKRGGNPEEAYLPRPQEDGDFPVLKKGGDVLGFEKAISRGVGKRLKLGLQSRRVLSKSACHETVTRKEVVAALCIALGKPDLGDLIYYIMYFGIRALFVQSEQAT